MSKIRSAVAFCLAVPTTGTSILSASIIISWGIGKQVVDETTSVQK